VAGASRSGLAGHRGSPRRAPRPLLQPSTRHGKPGPHSHSRGALRGQAVQKPDYEMADLRPLLGGPASFNSFVEESAQRRDRLARRNENLGQFIRRVDHDVVTALDLEHLPAFAPFRALVLLGDLRIFAIGLRRCRCGSGCGRRCSRYGFFRSAS